MLPLESLLTFFSVSLLLALAPGPDNLFVLAQSLVRGRGAGLAVTIGLCTGLILHTSLVVLGVAVLIQTSESALMLLKVLGAAYLLYLAWRFFRSSPVVTAAPADAPRTLTRLYRRGIFMNLSNPKVSLFFLAFLPQFTDASKGDVSLQMLLLGALFILSTLLVFGGIALLADVAGARYMRSELSQRRLNRVAGILFVVLACNLLLTRP